MTVYVCWARGVLYRRVMHCPTCDRRRRFACRFEAWYGVEVTCLGCGDRWCDGERAERPFMRGWRQESIARARRNWTDALDYHAARKAIRDEIREAVA
jgi:hypothetical protein